MKNVEECVTQILLEYAQIPPKSLPLSRVLSLKGDLAIESLSLVSVALRLGEEFEVDVIDAGLEMDRLNTVGDLFELAQTLQRRKVS